MSSKSKMPEKDPFDILGIQPGASDAEIAKAYRKLALTHHPDKQRTDATAAAKTRAEEQFQEIQWARSFLLDAEFEKERLNYETKRASEQMRRQADAAREAKMSDRRKRMREELKKQEELAANQKKRSKRGDKKSSVDELRRKGAEMREAYADRQVHKAAVDAVEEKQRLQNRQIRLKWSRKKMKESPSEHSIASMMSRFGAVEAVEMLGSKGNAALVTFANASSCRPCVEAYADSEEMRAKYVGDSGDQRREEEDDPPPAFMKRDRDTEGVDDWKVRRAAEREKMLREMEHADEDPRGRKRHRDNKKKRAPKFPPPFPDTDEYKGLESWEKLNISEAAILKGLVSPETLQQIQFGRVS